MLSHDIVRRIQRQLRAKTLSQREIARQWDVNLSTVSCIARGRCPEPLPGRGSGIRGDRRSQGYAPAEALNLALKPPHAARYEEVRRQRQQESRLSLRESSATLGEPVSRLSLRESSATLDEPALPPPRPRRRHFVWHYFGISICVFPTPLIQPPSNGERP